MVTGPENVQIIQLLFTRGHGWIEVEATIINAVILIEKTSPAHLTPVLVMTIVLLDQKEMSTRQDLAIMELEKATFDDHLVQHMIIIVANRWRL